jgi:polysaccharide deacetylase 2 family uncharacterized protein YibQ
MARYITGGLDKARKAGKAVMIGHAWSPDLAPLLKKELAVFEREGYSLAAASAIIQGK